MDKTINNNFEKLNAHKCQVCGLENIENEYDICEYCGWEADNLQVKQPDLMGGANKMSLNQYKQFWEENKKEILSADDCLKTAVDLADKYYQAHNFLGKTPKISGHTKQSSSSETTEYEAMKSLKKKKLARNEFEMVGQYQMPLIKKQDIDLDTIDLMCYRQAKVNDDKNQHKTIHFFTYD